MFTESARYPTFTDTMVGLNVEYGLGIQPQSIVMSLRGDEDISNTKDVAHDPRHYGSIGRDTEAILHRYPDLAQKIDWNAYTAAVAHHDSAISTLTPTPWNLWLSQRLEHRFAAKPAVRYMKTHNFSPDQIERVSYVVRTHPLGLDDPRRHTLEAAVDETLRLTGRLIYVTDGLDVFRVDRIRSMIAHIGNSFGGMSMVPFYPLLRSYFVRNVHHAIDLGPEYPWVREEAARRHTASVAYVDELVDTKRNVQHVVR